jgi:methylmalonyl-CoA mutase
MMIILAGYPKEQIQQYKATGVDDFIHLKSNNYETLVRCLEYLGVEL